MNIRRQSPNLGRFSGCRGFTLVEVMVSVAVFAIISVIFATSIPLADKASRMNGQYAQAISLCQHKIDQLRAVGYGRLNYLDLAAPGDIIDPGHINQPFHFEDVDQVGSYLPNPTATITIQNITPDKVARVTVTVRWKTASHESRNRQLSMSALIANVE